MTTIAVIPARFASTRFCGKPLVTDTGKYLIQHVFERVAAARSIDRVVVATDDDRIVAAVRSFGGEALLTCADHPSGTSRVGEAAADLGLADDDLVLNVQGDEPEIESAALDDLVRFAQDASLPIATLAARFDDHGPCDGPGSPADPNCVKVVVDRSGRALYFSRSLIPYPQSTGGRVDQPSRWLLHLGVYAFRASALRELTGSKALGAEGLEGVEALEQLRWLEAGYAIGVCLVDKAFVGIDTPEDYAAFVKRTLAIT